MQKSRYLLGKKSLILWSKIWLSLNWVQRASKFPYNSKESKSAPNFSLPPAVAELLTILWLFAVKKPQNICGNYAAT
jgi:hypothetical protein